MPAVRMSGSSRVRTAVTVLLTVALLVPAAAHGSAAPEIAASTAKGAERSACTDARNTTAAARDLYGRGAELVDVDTIAGMRSALVLEPRIAPGTRRRMVASDSGWCDAATGFNKAFHAATDGAAIATAYASVAAAPYFDGVTVTSLSETAPGVFAVETHALTNGIDARWVIVTDDAGVRTATWTATAFARKPFVAEIEGLSALPGGTETYTRVAEGLLAERRGLPTAESARRDVLADPQAPHVYTGPDGMEIRMVIGDSRVGVDPDVQTGQPNVDRVTDFADAIALNYQEFHDWGLRKGWESDLDPVLGKQVGWVYLNNALSLYCWACVFIADDFQIHITTEVTNILGALGFTGYTNDRDAIALVIGHEMFHNFQNAYNNPGPLGRNAGHNASTAYSEGTARMQETLHSYSDVTFADKTLVTGGQANPPLLSLDGNHCNGYGTSDQAFASGPFGKTYNSCFFWAPWFTQQGGDALVKLVTEGLPANSSHGSVEEGVRAIAAAAPDVPVAEQLAYFAHAALTGRNRSISALSGDPTPRDWGSFWFTWDPAVLDPGGSATLNISGGGVLGRRLTGPATVSLAGDGLALYEVRDSALGSSTTALPATGAQIAAPAEGESVWVVAVNPTVGTVGATLSAE